MRESHTARARCSAGRATSGQRCAQPLSAARPAGLSAAESGLRVGGPVGAARARAGNGRGAPEREPLAAGAREARAEDVEIRGESAETGSRKVPRGR